MRVVPPFTHNFDSVTSVPSLCIVNADKLASLRHVKHSALVSSYPVIIVKLYYSSRPTANKHHLKEQVVTRLGCLIKYHSIRILLAANIGLQHEVWSHPL